MAVFCFGRSRFASDGRVLLQTAAFCFEALCSGSNLYEIDMFISYKKPLFHERRSEQSEWASKRVSAAECASEASSLEQANEWCERTSERTSEWPSTLCVYSWITVRCILLRRTAFCVTRPWLPLDHHSKLQKKVFSIVQWTMRIKNTERRDGSVLQWDVFILHILQGSVTFLNGQMWCITMNYVGHITRMSW